MLCASKGDRSRFLEPESQLCFVLGQNTKIATWAVFSQLAKTNPFKMANTSYSGIPWSAPTFLYESV